MRIKFAFLAIFIALSFIGCNKEEVVFEVNEKITSDNGIIKIDSTLGFTVLVKHNTLCFPKSGEVFKAMDLLSKMTHDERRNWEKSIGFTSFQSIYEDIQSEILKDEKNVKFKSIVSDNKAFVKEASDCYLSIKPRVYGRYSYITNSLGYYISQAYVQKVFDGKLYSGYIYDLPAIAAKSHEGEEAPPFDLSKFEIEVITLEDDEPDNLKSYIEPDWANAYSGVRFRMGDEYDRDDWDKKARFTMGLVNYYQIQSTDTILTFTKYYYVVYYYCDYDPYYWDCGDCPGGYSGYYNDFGNWYAFVESSGGDYWKVEVPYNGYFNDEPGNKPPDGEYETYINEVYEKRYYNWTGRVDVTCEFEAQHMNWGQWRTYDGTISKLTDIRASVKIGFNNPGYSNEIETSINPFNFNLVGEEGKQFLNYSQTAYYFPLLKYEVKPTVRFKCITGGVYVRFCPSGTYNMSYNF
jgi:hypothetical protein